MSIDWGHALPVLGAVIAVWAVRALLWPFAPCRWCSGRRGRTPGSTSRRWGNCWACGGSGRRQVLGSRTLHRALRGRRK